MMSDDGRPNASAAGAPQPAGGLGGGPPGLGPHGVTPLGGGVNTTLPIVLSIIGFVLCFVPSSVLFGIAFAFSLQANTLLKAGDIAGAQAKKKTAMLLIVVGFVAGGLTGGLIALVANGTLH